MVNTSKPDAMTQIKLAAAQEIADVLIFDKKEKQGGEKAELPA